MSRYTLSPLARADLENIWSYTADHWDVNHAEAYIPHNPSQDRGCGSSSDARPELR
ncbi:MAG TPA: type II toxin-antitoxin system RelE/ParE family toxin [Allosphingosinicella sp.]